MAGAGKGLAWPEFPLGGAGLFVQFPTHKYFVPFVKVTCLFLSKCRVVREFGLRIPFVRASYLLCNGYTVREDSVFCSNIINCVFCLGDLCS